MRRENTSEWQGRTTPLERRQTPRPQVEELAGITLFGGLSHSQLSQVGVYLQSRCLPVGTTFIRQGETGSGLFFLVQGSVKVFSSPSGETMGFSREVLISICGPGETLGEIDLVDGAGHTANVATLEQSALWWMGAEDFWRCHQLIPGIGRNLYAQLARRTRWSTATHDALSTLHLPGKVAFVLLLLMRDYGQPQADGSILLPLRLSRDEIASMIGSARECVSRVLTTFKEQGYLEVRPKKQVVIRDARALGHYCEGLIPSPIKLPASE